MTDQVKQNDLILFRSWQRSPRAFIASIWGLTPQRDNSKFVKGEHLTWQQDDILQAVEDALTGKSSKRISIKAGHGIGKSCTLAWLVIWYLICFKDAQIPCTAPTADQMHDVLWKEIKKWIDRMPKQLGEKLIWTTGYLRVSESPDTWFARAKTARKEAPEALAGVHGDFVMMLVDEASGVPEEIFNTAEGALTSKDILFIMISNPTRLLGYFYNSHHADRESWNCLSFSCIESPIVDNAYVDRIKDRHGSDSDEYKIRVVGEFPKADAIDDKGFVPLLLSSDVRETKDEKFVGDCIMGIDPAGEGSDETVWVVRDTFKAKIVAVEKVSTGKSIAQKTLTLMDYYHIQPFNVIVDSFGEGVKCIQELATARAHVKAVNVGIEANDTMRFLNRRAEAFWELKEWLRQGGELVTNEGWQELLTIRYRRELSGKLKIMSKLDMRKEGIRSPNKADALMLTFADGGISLSEGRDRDEQDELLDRFAIFSS